MDSKQKSDWEQGLSGIKTDIMTKIQNERNVHGLGGMRKIPSSLYGSSEVMGFFFEPAASNISTNFQNEDFGKTESVNSSNTDSSSHQNESSTTSGNLTDMKNIKKMYPIILGNLPEAFTAVNVLDLVAECEPSAMTDLYHTKGQKLKFCEIYFKNPTKVTYLKKKLDGFVLCGKKLIAVPPSHFFNAVNWEI